MNAQTLIDESRQYLANGGDPRHQLDQHMKAMIERHKKNPMGAAEDIFNALPGWQKSGYFDEAARAYSRKQASLQKKAEQAEKIEQERLNKLSLRKTPEFKALQNVSGKHLDVINIQQTLDANLKELNQKLHAIKKDLRVLLDQDEPDFSRIGDLEREERELLSEIGKSSAKTADHKKAVDESKNGLASAKNDLMAKYYELAAPLISEIERSISDLLTANEQLQLLSKQAEGFIPTKAPGSMYPGFWDMDVRRINSLLDALKKGKTAYSELIVR